MSKCKHTWSKKESVDSRVLNKWEHKVHECIDEKKVAENEVINVRSMSFVLRSI